MARAAAAAWESLREPYPRTYCLLRAAEAALAERRPKAGAAAALSTAYELACGHKTAGAHVSRILAKLGVARRVEAAAIAERLDLLEGVAPEATR